MISISTDKLLKRCYVNASRALRSPLGARLEAASKSGIAESRSRLWFRSLFAIHDIDEMNRLDLAWWQLDALAEVDRFLRRTPGARVFEYGSGASTLWLARRASEVVSVEHDRDWHAVLAGKLSAYPHVALRLVPGSPSGTEGDAYRSDKPGAREMSFRDYVHAIEDEPGAFDLIVIDGRCRVSCLDAARAKLKPGGMILFDNSNRARYRSGLEASGLRSKRYWGLTACLPYPDETTLLWSGS
jgi:hypothetical protein